MPLKVGDVEVFMGPTGVGAPDDLEGAIVEFIEGARKELLIAAQEIDSPAIAAAIIERRQKGVRVRAVVEQDYLLSGKITDDPYFETGRTVKNDANRVIASAMLRTDIDVRADYNGNIFHQKFIVRDGTALLTGSTNFTSLGTGKNLNHVVTIRSKTVARKYADEFGEIRQGRFGKRSVDRDETPEETSVSHVPVKVLFAPDHAPEMEIMKQMLKAASRIDFAMYTFSTSSGIDDTMTARLESGIPVRGAMESMQGNRSWAASHGLKAAGADIFMVKKKGPLGKLHHKLMVIDDEVTIVGSFNYTDDANRLNDENIIVLGDKDTTSAAKRAAQRKIAKYARAEIDRIIADHGEAF